jgi:hypothetical protein
VEGVKKHLSALLLCASIALFSSDCNRVSWPVSREFCGQIQVIDNQGSKMLRSTELLLYRTDSNSRCCSKAERIGEIRADDEGHFNSGALAAGKYFLVVKDSPEVVFPMRLETDYEGKKCSLNTDFSFDKNTGKAQQTVIIKVESDALPKKAN